jgi:hypothetical protein
MCDLLQSLERWLDVTIFNAGDVGHREPTGPTYRLRRRWAIRVPMFTRGFSKRLSLIWGYYRIS